MSIDELIDELHSLIKSNHPGWDRQAEALIAKAFYGDCKQMVVAYIHKLQALRELGVGRS